MKKKLPNNAYIGEAELVFMQSGDCIENGLQELHVHIQDGGGGFFIALDTERWAIDSPDDLTEVLKAVNVIMKEISKYQAVEEGDQI